MSSLSSQDHGSHDYITARIARIKEPNLKDKISASLHHAESFMRRYPQLDYALLLPTATALSKGIIDAVGPVRDFLSRNQIHDYTDQRQGIGNKVVVDGYLVTATKSLGSSISLYRPTTKHGDPRLWLFQLAQYIEPFDLLLLVYDGYTVYVIDTSTDFEKNKRLGNIIERCTSKNRMPPVVETLLGYMQEICAKGFIPSIKSGDTGVGMTLENQLGEKPNSYSGPDWNGIELKAHRIGRNEDSRRRTLFSQIPSWEDSTYTEAQLISNFGYYDSGKKRQQLYTTVYGNHRDPLGFQLINDADSDHMNLSYANQQASRVVPTAATWRMEDVRKHFRDKHNITFWVGAETRRVNGHEEFRYTDVSITHTPDYMRMEEFIANGWITVDLAMYLKPSKNDPQRLVSRDHGFLWKANGKGMQGLFSKGIRYDLKS